MPKPARTALALIALTCIYACDPTQPLLGPREVDVTPARRATIAEVVDHEGVLLAPARIDVVARTDGYLLERRFEDGSTIEQNQVIFVLESEPYELEVEEAQARLEAAEAAHRLAKAEIVNRNEPSAAEEAPPTARVDAAAAALRGARAALEQAKLTASYTTLRAPTGGTMIDRRADVGNLVQAGDPLATIVQLDPIHLEFAVEASDLHRLQVAHDETPILVQVVDVGGQVHPHPGRVEVLHGGTDPETGRSTVRATIPNPKNFLGSGQAATARLLLRWHIDSVLVPASAVHENAEGAYVRIVGSDGRVEHRAIEPGPEQSGERVILQGLAEDELVVVGRAHAAVPGRSVDIERKSFTPQPTPAAAPRITPPGTPQPETADESTRLP